MAPRQAGGGTVILDTSVLYDSLVEARFSGAARDLIRSDAPMRAPDLLLVEIGGAITRAVRRGDLTIDTAQRLHERARRLAPETDRTERFIERAFALSLELQHPISDCIFLAQAEMQADVLVTGDEHLLRKLAGTAHAGRAIHVKDWRL
jgi:predicted nucleic acid-binding protein